MRFSKRVSVFLVGGALTAALSALAPAVYAQCTDGAIGTGNGSFTGGRKYKSWRCFAHLAQYRAFHRHHSAFSRAIRMRHEALQASPAFRLLALQLILALVMRNKPMNPSGSTNPVNPDSGSSTNLGGVNP